MIRTVLFFITICIFGSSTAQAQHSLVLQKLNEWNDAAPALSTETFLEELRKTAKNVYKANEGCVETGVLIDKVHPATADRFVFTSLIRSQLRNAWTITARLPGCDPAPVRFMVMQNSDSTLRTIRVNRGNSYAHDCLIGDTLPLAVVAASAKLNREGISCNVEEGYKLGVTRIESEENGLGPDTFGVRYKGSWSEVWPIETCGRTIEVLVKFTADGDGGAYTDLPGKKVRILSN